MNDIFYQRTTFDAEKISYEWFVVHLDSYNFVNLISIINFKKLWKRFKHLGKPLTKHKNRYLLLAQIKNETVRFRHLGWFSRSSITWQMRFSFEIDDWSNWLVLSNCLILLFRGKFLSECCWLWWMWICQHSVQLYILMSNQSSKGKIDLRRILDKQVPLNFARNDLRRDDSHADQRSNQCVAAYNSWMVPKNWATSEIRFRIKENNLFVYTIGKTETFGK